MRKKISKRGAGFGSFFEKAIKMAVKRAKNSDAEKMLISKGLKQLPGLYRKGILREKNKRVRALLISDVANNYMRSGSNKFKFKMY